MCLVPVADGLEVLDADHIADAARIDYGLERLSVGCIAEYVTDGEDPVVGKGRLDDPPAVRLVGSHGLLEHDVVAHVGEGDRGVGMHRVLCGDDNAVSELRPGGDLAPVGEDAVWGDPMLCGDTVAVEITRLRDTDDPHLVGVLESVTGIPGPAATTAYHDQLYGMHT